MADLTKSDIIRRLNDITFMILYIISFVFIFNSNTELIGLLFLFVTHTLTSIYLIKNIFSVQTEFGKSFVPVLTQFTIPTAMILQFIGLILVFVMLSSLRTTYTLQLGKPLALSETFNQIMTQFKWVFIANFVLIIALYCMLFYSGQLINQPIVKILLSASDIFFEIIDQIVLVLLGKSIQGRRNVIQLPGLDQVVTVFAFIINIVVLALSSYQVYLSDQLSKINRLSAKLLNNKTDERDKIADQRNAYTGTPSPTK